MNVLVGIVIGIANDSWPAVLIVSAGWPLVFCVYVSLIRAERARATIAVFEARGSHFLFGSPFLTFYAIEFATALVTTLPVAIVSHVIKRLLV